MQTMCMTETRSSDWRGAKTASNPEIRMQFKPTAPYNYTTVTPLSTPPKTPYNPSTGKDVLVVPRDLSVRSNFKCVRFCKILLLPRVVKEKTMTRGLTTIQAVNLLLGKRKLPSRCPSVCLSHTHTHAHSPQGFWTVCPFQAVQAVLRQSLLQRRGFTKRKWSKRSQRPPHRGWGMGGR